MSKELAERIVSLLMLALKDEQLSEKAWKRIAKLNELILHKYAN